MSQAQAYLLTWTTYGTWLRGDPRGYVGNTLLGTSLGVAPKNNEYGSPYDADQGRTFNWDLAALKSQPVTLTGAQAQQVAEALIEVAERSHYELLRVSIMSDHVHVLVSAHDDGKEEIARRLKNVTAVRLTQQFGRPAPKDSSCSDGGRWWTRDSNKRESRDRAALMAAEDYVAKQAYKLAEIVDNRVIAQERGYPSAEAEGS
jgi:REP element-mobilizing transposase RayT